MSRNVSSSRVPEFSLGERIRKAREDQELSQQRFADMLGVDRKTLGGWENGRHRPGYGDLMLVSSVGDVSLEWLAGDLYRPTTAVSGGSGDRVDAPVIDRGQGGVNRRYRLPAVTAAAIATGSPLPVAA
jgi:transcriptional regulator with XRE-family HTH domain